LYCWASLFSKSIFTRYRNAPNTDDSLKKIFILLRAQTGHDFSQYKFSTINRRISRRMACQKIKVMEEYVRYLQQTPVEVEALFQDFLIGDTSFFRDPEAFAVLQDIGIPQLFADRSDGDRIRVWVPGCSSGEEAYSIAILIQEYLMNHGKKCEIQMFATDINVKAIEVARAGSYPLTAVAGISSERLLRYFTPDNDSGGYRICKEIRDMLLFSEQDVIKDPSFSKIDLISCRNLLIYMNSDLHKKILNVFHYSLNPGGLLFLGKAETAGGQRGLFSPLDRRMRLYQRKEPSFKAGSPEALRYIPTLTENFSSHRAAEPQRASEEPNSGEKSKIVNAELQLTKEDLQACREELQAVNEELAAVSGELQANLKGVSRANDDMDNVRQSAQGSGWR
jgi:two-component system CheB/CheR fusion protein